MKRVPNSFVTINGAGPPPESLKIFRWRCTDCGKFSKQKLVDGGDGIYFRLSACCEAKMKAIYAEYK